MIWFMLLLVAIFAGFVWWKVGWKEGVAALVGLATGVWAVFSDFFHTILQ